MRKLNKEDLENILYGCSYLGCGGGGSLPEGLKRIYQDLKAGLEFKLMPVEEMGDDEYAASPYGVGSTAPVTPEREKQFASLPRIRQEPTEASFRLLERYSGKKFVAVYPGEIGPGNTAWALSAAAHLGVATLDADQVGRATPEINQNSVLVAGVPTVPAAAASQFGDEIILEKVASTSREEEIFRAISVVSLGIGVTDSAIPGRTAKRPGVLVVRSVSHAEKIGKAYRKAIESHRNPIQAVVEAGEGYRLFEGRIADFDWKDEGGYLVGDVTLSGVSNSDGSRYRVWYKNENILSWRDGQVDVTPPDLISLIVTDTGQAVPNPHFEKDQKVTIVGFKAPDLWRTADGLKAFGPKHFGFDVPYIPIEERHRRN